MAALFCLTAILGSIIIDGIVVGILAIIEILAVITLFVPFAGTFLFRVTGFDSLGNATALDVYLADGWLHKIITFVVINYLSYKKNIIKVMERDEQDGLGTVYYAVALLILAIVSFGILKQRASNVAPFDKAARYQLACLPEDPKILYFSIFSPKYLLKATVAIEAATEHIF